MAAPVITNASPTATAISWTASRLTYGGNDYPIPAGNMTTRFAVWRLTGSTPGTVPAGGSTGTGGTSNIIYTNAIVLDGAGTNFDELTDVVLFLNKDGIGFFAGNTSVLEGGLIVNGSILADAIGANQVTTTKLDAFAVTAAKLAANSVEAEKIKAGAVNTGHLSARSVTANKLSLGVFSQNLAPNPFFEDWFPADPAVPSVYTQMPDAWSLSTAAGYEGATATRVTSGQLSGGVSLGITAAAGKSAAFFASQALPCLGGQDIYLGAYFHGTVPTTYLNGIAAGVYYYNAAGALIATQQTAADIVTNTITSIQHLDVAPATARYFQPLFVSIATQQIIFDNIELAYRQHGAIITPKTLSIESINTSFIGSLEGQLEIIADQIKTGDLTAAMTLGGTEGRIRTIGTNGQEVSMHSTEGFKVVGYDPATQTNPTTVSFPVNGGSNIISSTLQAGTLIIDGDATTGQAATFRRNSALEPGATLTLNDTIADPVSVPVFEAFPSSIQTLSDGTVAESFEDGSALSDGIWYNGEYYFVQDKTTPKLLKWNPTTNKYSRVVTTLVLNSRSDLTCKGVTRVTGVNGWRFLWMNINGQTTDGDTVIIQAQSDTFVPGVELTIPAVGTQALRKNLCISTDGTNIWLGGQSGGTGLNQIVFRKFAAALSSATPTETITTANAYLNGTGEMLSFTVGNFDFGARTFVTTAWLPGAAVQVFDTTGMRLQTHDWVLSLSKARTFVFYDGTNFRTFATYGDSMIGSYTHVYKWSQIIITGVNNQQSFYGQYSWFRSSDSKESAPSQQQHLTMKSRYWWRMTTAMAPSGLQIRTYVGTTTSGTGSTAPRLQVTIPAGSTSAESQTYLTTNALAPSVSTLGATTPSQVKSQATSTVSLSAVGTTLSSATITGVSKFRPWMVGQTITTTPSVFSAGTTVVSVATDRNSAVLSTTATATNASLKLEFPSQPKLMLRGDGSARIFEIDELIISGNDDANALTGNTPALRIGQVTGKHLRMDGDEIISMDSDTVQGLLNLNQAGKTRAGGGSSGRFQVGTSGTEMTVIEFGAGSVSPNAQGIGTYTHGLGLGNYHVLITPRGNTQPRHFTVMTKNTNNFDVRVDNASGAVVTAAGQTFDYVILGKN